MLGAIKNVDLIAAEFKKYRKCYRENILRFYLKQITRKELKNRNQFTGKGFLICL